MAESEEGDNTAPSIKDFADDALSVLDTLDWHENVHIVGVSMGGMIAQELALLDQGRFSSLTLIATHAGGPLIQKAPPIEGALRFLGSFWLPRAFRVKSIRGILYPKHFLENMDQEALAKRIHLQLGRPPNKRTSFRQLKAVVGFDTRGRLAQLMLPTLVVKPGMDILINPKHSDALHRHLPNSELLEYPDAGHGVIYQCAESLNRAIAAHVKKNRSN